MGEDNRGSRKHNGFTLQALWLSEDPIHMMFEVRSRMTYQNGLSLLHRFDSTISIAFYWPSEASYRSPICSLKCIIPCTVEIKVNARVERNSHGNWLFLSLYTCRQYLSTVMGEDNRGSRKHNGFALQALWPSKDPIHMMFEVRSRMTYRNSLSLLHRTLLPFKALIQLFQ
jgi:hypothetical protein